MRDILDIVKDRLRENEFRLTPQRKAVLDILMENKDNHLTAEEIYSIARKRYPEIGLATIYRTLDLLVELGIAAKLEFGEKGARYEFNPQGGHYHHHLICLSCGKITEFNDDLLEDLERKISQASGFLITDHSLRFYGICRECRKKR